MLTSRMPAAGLLQLAAHPRLPPLASVQPLPASDQPPRVSVHSLRPSAHPLASSRCLTRVPCRANASQEVPGHIMENAGRFLGEFRTCLKFAKGF